MAKVWRLLILTKVLDNAIEMTCFIHGPMRLGNGNCEIVLEWCTDDPNSTPVYLYICMYRVCITAIVEHQEPNSLQELLVQVE
jgi:hypothetical protein